MTGWCVVIVIPMFQAGCGRVMAMPAGGSARPKGGGGFPAQSVAWVAKAREGAGLLVLLCQTYAMLQYMYPSMTEAYLF